MHDDRLGWIFEAPSPSSLQSRYDAWASTYDADHDDWGWVGPEHVAEAVLRIGSLSHNATIHDAGCGTGKAGAALRRAGFSGTIVGLDLSWGMLDVAAKTGAYNSLVQCSLTELPFAADVTDAIVSSGVFTEGHVGGEAFGELCRVTRPGGLITSTQRLDLIDTYQPHADALEAGGWWTVSERSPAKNLHPDREHVEQIVMTWQVLAPGTPASAAG